MKNKRRTSKTNIRTKSDKNIERTTQRHTTQHKHNSKKETEGEDE